MCDVCLKCYEAGRLVYWVVVIVGVLGLALLVSRVSICSVVCPVLWLCRLLRLSIGLT